MNGLYIGDSWERFLAQRERIPSWKIPLNIAVVLHLVVFAGAAVLPDVGKRHKPDKVITIDLLSLPPAAPVAVQQVAARRPREGAAPRQAKVVQEKKVKKTVEPAAPQVTVQAPAPPVVVPKKRSTSKRSTSASHPAPVAQTKPVSLHPLKRKKKLAQDIRLAEEKERARLAALQEKRRAEQRKQEKAAVQEKKLAARKKRQQEAVAKKRLAAQQRRQREVDEAARLAREAELAAEQARLEAARVRQEYASVAQAVSDLNTPLASRSGGRSSGGRGEPGNGVSGGYGAERISPAVLNQYAASLNGRISSHWQLPEIVKKKPHLRTMIALTVRRDGTIEDMRIEQKSGDSFFDQSVVKALQSSAPLPGFPALINTPTLEFALNFTPQGLAL